MTRAIPHIRIVITFSFLAIAGYGLCSVWVMISGDAAMKGGVIGTWKSFGVLAFGFWLGSSSGGKAQEDRPQAVQIEQPPDSPVPVTTTQEPAP